jgi:biopolymer transport protein ExbB
MKSFIRVCGVALALGAALVLGEAFERSPLSPIGAAQAQQAQTLDQLLRQVRQGRLRDQQEFRQREADFRARRAEQQRILRETEAALAREERRSDELEATFQENERELAALEQQLTERLGEFGEVLGVVRQVAGDTRANLNQSMISAQFPGRQDRLEPLTSSRELPTAEQLAELWYVLQQEMTEQGRIVEFSAPVTRLDGRPDDMRVIRVGPFTAISKTDGRYLKFEADTGELEYLPRQPAARFRDAANRLRGADPGEVVSAALDPSSGAILGLLVQTPDLIERVQQGRQVGYIIIALGSVGILLALQRIMSLTMVSGAVKAQMRNTDNPKKGNPLGRVLLAYEENKKADVETLELKLDDAILKELPKLEWGLNTIKVMAAVSPLLGLLGTVTGMIIVFQQITLFGTGDPRMMAGGISQALVTTVLGLTFAIPLLLLHSLASGRAKSVAQVLEEQSAGIVAAHAEGKGRR